MVKRSVEPGSRGVAERAILWEICRDVIRCALNIRCASEIRRVAAVTRGGQRARVIVGVAGSASDSGVRASQRERRRVVIKRRVQPRRSRVALRANL